MLESQSRARNTRILAKMARWVGAQDQVGKLGQEGENMPPLLLQPQKTQAQNEKKLFQSKLEDFPNP